MLLQGVQWHDRECCPGFVVNGHAHAPVAEFRVHGEHRLPETPADVRKVVLLAPLFVGKRLEAGQVGNAEGEALHFDLRGKTQPAPQGSYGRMGNSLEESVGYRTNGGGGDRLVLKILGVIAPPPGSSPQFRCRRYPLVCRQRTSPSEPTSDFCPYSITSSARARSVDGTAISSAFAVFRLITSSYLVGACTGSSPGFCPLRTRSTYPAAPRYSSNSVGP